MPPASINKIYHGFSEAYRQNKPLFAALIDPENLEETSVNYFLSQLPEFTTHIFIGGSTATRIQTQECVRQLRPLTRLPLILFPGGYEQVVSGVDAVLFLSLLSGRNPDYLIGEQVKAAPLVRKFNLETLATGYILIDTGSKASVARVSKTQPIGAEDVDELVHTALAGVYSGKKLIYLEAGSGAINPVPCNVIRAIRDVVKIPLVVGGGIQNKEQMQNIYDAGATMVVAGTSLEKGIFKE